MPSIPFADNFLAGSILSLLMPVCLLIAIAIWYVLTARRLPEDTPASSPSLPPPEVVAAASPSPAESPQPQPPAGES
jgi:cytoskeletal protein RodZ